MKTEQVRAEQANGNTKVRFTKTAHLFAHRKQGVQHRFEKAYVALADKVRTAFTADLLRIEQEIKNTGKYNQALASTKKDRLMEMAEKQAREVMSTVFADWRKELDRIVNDLSGYPQEDGNVLFPDGSVAKMPRGLYIPPEQLLKFE